MRLTKLYLKDFRAWDEAVFTFGPGVNLIYGPNAQGKTTILEAIYLLIAGRSFRTARTAELIREGQERFFVAAHFQKCGIEQVLKFSFDGACKSIIYNNTKCKGYSSLFGLMQGVAMTPDDVELVKGAPAMRRQFLDVQLAQSDPLYVYHLSRYNRAMKQRNVLLKTRRDSGMALFENEMAKAAAYVIVERRKAASEMLAYADLVHQHLSESKESLKISYKSGAPNGNSDQIYQHYIELWKKQRAREMELGFTIAGPHKDDMEVLVAGKEARYFASEGQQRSCIASLRLSGWKQLEKKAGLRPLMLVDDVGVSMDQSRKTELLLLLGNLEQVFLTTTEDIDLPASGVKIRV